MGKHREMDPGVQYLKEIGFNRVRGVHGLIDSWNKLYGSIDRESFF